MSRRVRIAHVALWTRELEQLRDFYVTALDGESGPRYHNPETGFTSYFIAFGDGCRLELMHRPGREAGVPTVGTGFAHIAISLGGRHAVDAVLASLRQRDVTVAAPPRLTGDGYYEAVILDPEGNQIELTE